MRKRRAMVVWAACVLPAAAWGGCSAKYDSPAYWSEPQRLRAELQQPGVRVPGAPAPMPPAAVPAGLVAAYDAAVGMVDAGQYPRAEAKFAELIGPLREAKDLERSAKAWFWMAFCKEKQGQRDAAAEEYRKLTAQQPGSRAAMLAKGRLEKLGNGPVYKGP